MNTTALILAIVGSTGLWQLLTEIYRQKRTKKTPLEQGILAELHLDIYEITDRAIHNKEISMDDWENLEELYAPYQALGGNGKGKARYEECRELPKVERYK